MHLVIYKLSASLQFPKYQGSLITARLSREARAWVLRSLLRAEMEHSSHLETYTDTRFALGLT